MRKFEYSSNQYYFVTICTHGKKCIFGTTKALSTMGQIAKADMMAIENHYKNVHIDHFIVMPNHIHAIVVIENTGITSLYTVIGSYKAGVSRKIRKLVPNTAVWQRSFHDHIIRNQKDYENIWNYIEYNPQKWEDDCFYPGDAKP